MTTTPEHPVPDDDVPPPEGAHGAGTEATEATEGDEGDESTAPVDQT